MAKLLPRKTEQDAVVHKQRILEIMPTVLEEMGITNYKLKIKAPFSPLSWLITDTDGYYYQIIIYVPKGMYKDFDILDDAGQLLLNKTEVGFYLVNFVESDDLSKN